MRRNERLITCNREWTGITVLTKRGKRIFLDYSQIEEIRLGYHTISRLFSRKVTEKIEIVPKGMKKTIILTKPMDWDRFEQYKEEVSKFAIDNKIPLIGND